MISTKFIILISVISLTMAQRPSYAGSRPLGYKDRFVPKNNTNNDNNTEIANRFGLDSDATQRPPLNSVAIVYGEAPSQADNFNNNFINERFGEPTSTQQQPQQQPSRIPIDALGDIGLVNRISSEPIDHQPFWFLNSAAIEAHRRGNGNNSGPNIIAPRPSFLGK